MHRMMMTAAVVAAMAAPAVADGIGFVDVERAVATIGEGRAKLEQLQEWAAPQEARIREIQQEFQQAQQDLAAARAAADQQQLEALRQRVVTAQRQGEDAVREFRRQLQAQETEVLSEVAEKLDAVIREYAADNGYDAVMPLRQDNLLFLAEDADLTDEIVAAYDARHPVS